MSVREGASRRVSFDTREELNDKIDKLAVMLGKLAAKDSGRTRPQIHQSRGRGRNRGYSQRNYQNRYRSDNRSNSKDRGQLRQDRGRHRFEQGYGRSSPQTTPEDTVDRIVEESIGIIVIEMMVTTEVGTGLEKDHFQKIMAVP